RDEFPTFRTTTYLNTCSLAPLAARVRAAQERFLDEWEALGASAWYELWVDALDSLRGKVALVLGARREEIALAPSVSVALSAVASALDYAERPRVVLSDLEFPTLSYQWAVKPAVERVFVPSKDGVRVSPDLFASADDCRLVRKRPHVRFRPEGVRVPRRCPPVRARDDRECGSVRGKCGPGHRPRDRGEPATDEDLGARDGHRRAPFRRGVSPQD